MIVERFLQSQDFHQLAGDELRPDATAHVTLAIRADQKFAPRNSMLNADTRFTGLAMRIKEDQCSYTNHQNDVTYYNMVNQQNSKFPIIHKVPLPLSFTTIVIIQNRYFISFLIVFICILLLQV